MMFLIWVGSFILFIFAASKVQALISVLFGELRKTWFLKMQELGVGAPVSGAILMSTSSSSPFKQEASALQFYNLRTLKKRPALLWLCFGSLGFAVPYLLSFFYLKVNGLLILGATLVVWLVGSAFSRKMFQSRILECGAWVGLFYFFAENLLRQNSVFQSVLGTHELTFLFVDRRGQALLLMVLMGFVKSFFIPLSGWSFWFSLALVPLGSLSLPSGLCLIFGELLFHGFWLSFQMRKTNSESKKAANQFAMVQTLGSLLGLGVSLFLIDAFQWGGFSAGDLHSLVEQFLFGTAFMLFFRTVASLFWGHFASQSQEQEMQEASYSLFIKQPRYFDFESIHQASEAVHKRLNEIKYYQMGLQNQDLVPESLKNRVEKELKALLQISQELSQP